MSLPLPALLSLVSRLIPTLPGVPTRPGAALDPPASLRCEYRTNPLGVDVPRPELSWTLRSDERGVRQEAYQVVAASNPSLLRPGAAPDMWDSGRVESDQSISIPYGGRPLESGERAYWSVRVWPVGGGPTEFAAPAAWEMGILAPEDWHARWISLDAPLPARDEDFFKESPGPILRAEFTLPTVRIRRARAYVSGLGYYELRMDGRKVGDHELDPGWTDPARRVLYSTFDVTELLRRAGPGGAHAIGVVLGNGWYNPLPIWGWGSPERNLRRHLTVGRPRAIVQLVIDFDDGTRRVIASDESWKASTGPIIRDSNYLGEEFDADREPRGWDRAGFDDRDWRPAALPTDLVGPLRAQSAPPIRVVRSIRPVSVASPAPGVAIFDMGENFAGRVRFDARAVGRARVTMRSGELLFSDGTLNGRTSAAMQVKVGGASGGPGCPVEGWQTDVHASSDFGAAPRSPRFTFHGFRFVEVTGLDALPSPGVVEGEAMCSDVRTVGEFSCSNELFNRIHRASVRTFRSNLYSVQSDCPHREKFGYGGDLVATSEAFIMNFDMSAFYRKSVEDLADAARANGGFTETAPFVGIADESLGDGAGPVEWGTAHPHLCEQLWRYYGDRRTLREQYASLLRWTALLESKAKDGILVNGIGDHESLVPRSIGVTGTAFYAYNAALGAEIADVLGEHRDAERFRSLRAAIETAFAGRFVDGATGRIDTGTQCNQAIALRFGLVPPERRGAVLDVLARGVADARSHLTTGIFGTPSLLFALSDLGRADLACAIVGNESFPGWGHMLANGATTLWETWAFSDNVYSHNHPMFGSVDAWLFQVVAGVRPADDAVGFDRIVFRPLAGHGVGWARAAYDSVRGRVAISWRVDGGRLRLEIEVPCNTSAIVHVPAPRPEDVLESGRPALGAAGIDLVERATGETTFRVGSGRYVFECDGAGAAVR